MDKYTFLEKLGRGTHGTVYLLKHNQSFVVCKSFNNKYHKYATREINILSKLNHKRIIKLIEATTLDNNTYLIMEHANNFCLEDVINKHKKSNIGLNLDMEYQKLVWSFIAQVSDAIFYLHTKNIIHRDIKPANILLNKTYINQDEFVNEFKICDFSLSTTKESNSCNVVGTPFYMAPEILRKETYDEKVDVWSFGVVLYEMAALKRPFNGKTRKDLQTSILETEISTIQNVEDESLLYDIIMDCLEKRKEDRVSMNEIRRMDRIRYNLAVHEIKMREKRIYLLEERLKEVENGGYLRTPESSGKKNR